MLTGLTFKQGIVLGILLADRFHKNSSRLLAEAASVGDAFDFGVALFGSIKSEFAGKVLPEFPEGIPSDAFDVSDELLPALLSEGLI